MAVKKGTGYPRTKSRAQAQQEVPWHQEWWTGGENSDSPASAIGLTECAIVENAISHGPAATTYRALKFSSKGFQRGRQGTKIVSKVALPGSGTAWSRYQNPITRQWLLHRGSSLWISSDSTCTAWTQIFKAANDGYTQYSADQINGNNGDITNLIIRGQSLNNTFAAGAGIGRLYWILADVGGITQFSLYNDADKTQLVAIGTTMDESGVVDNPPVTYAVIPISCDFISGANAGNTDSGVLYYDFIPGTISHGGGSVLRLFLYDNPAKPEITAEGEIPLPAQEVDNPPINNAAGLVSVNAVYGGTPANTNAGSLYWDLVFNPLLWASSGVTATLQGLAWDGTQYIAVGLGGTILTSPDGAAWTARSSGTTNDLYGVFAGGTRIIVVGASGTILTSPNGDGATWTPRVSGVTVTLRGIEASVVPVVAVGDSGTILTSTDVGTTWSSVGPGGSTVSLYAVVAGFAPTPTLSCVGTSGGSGIGFVSTDSGATWSSSDVGFSTALYGITYGGPAGWVAVGPNTIQTSTDGNHWGNQTLGAPSTLNTVEWTGEIYIACGNNGNIQRSADGITWDSTPSGYSYSINAVGKRGGDFSSIFVGSSGSILLENTVGGAYGFNVYSDTAKIVLVAQSLDIIGNTPNAAAFVNQIGGSGLSLSISVSSLTTQFPSSIVSPLSTITGCVVTGTSTLIVTGSGLYASFQVPNLLQGADEAPGNEISGCIPVHAGLSWIAQQNGSGIGGYIEFNYTADQNSPDDYVDVVLDTDFVSVQSRIRATVNDFVVSTSQGLFYVATTTNIFYKISPASSGETTGTSYPNTRPADSGSSTQATQKVRQYVTTFVRLESSPGVASYDGNRNTRELKFESASTQADASSIDYTTVARADSPEQGTPTPVPWLFYFKNGVVFPELQAAGHYTHVGIYSTQTLNYINPLTQLAANADVLVWEGDIPLTQGFVIDDIDDPTLAGRISANAVLETRGYRNIGSSIAMEMSPAALFVRNDAKPTQTLYSIPADPAYFGFQFAAQALLADAPVIDIARSGANQFTVMGKSLTYGADPTQTQQLSQQTSIAIITQFPKIDPALGIKEWNAFAYTTQATIMALCSDNTIKEFNGTQWGADITYLKIGNIVKMIQPQPVLLFLNGSLYLFYRLSASQPYNNLGYRFGFGGQAGSGWGRLTGAGYPFLAMGFGSAGVGVDESEIPRIYLVDRATSYTHITENFPDGAVWKDGNTYTIFAASLTGPAGSWIQNARIPNYAMNQILYGYVVRGVTPSLVFFATEADRAANTNILGRITALNYDVENLGAAIVALPGSQLSGTMDVGVIPSVIGGPVAFNMTFGGLLFQDGSSIAVRIRFRETVGPREGWLLYHQESRYHVRPADPEGYLPGMMLTANVYADGAAIPSDSMSPVPIAGAVQYGNLAQGQRVQTELVFSESGAELVSVDSLFQARDVSALPQPMGPNIGYQQELADCLLYWNVRNLQQDRASSLFYAYPLLAPSLIAGPDGCVDALSTNGPIVLTNTLAAPRWIQFWTDAEASHDIVRLVGPNNAGISISDDVLVVQINGEDTFRTSIQPITDWTHFAIEFTGTAINVYQNAVLVGTAATSDALPATMQVVIDPDNVGLHVFDVLIKGNSLSVAALAYYYKNILTGGQDVLPW